MTERICLRCKQPKDILVSLCNECKASMSKTELDEFYNGYEVENKISRLRDLNAQAADLIEAQHMLIKKHETMISDLKHKLNIVEKERTSFCDMYIKEQKRNKELQEYNCILENKLTSLGG